MGATRTGNEVPKVDTRFSSYKAYCQAVFRALQGKGLSRVASLMYLGFAIKAQRGWLPSGRLWNFNLWGVKAQKAWRDAGKPFFVGYGSERLASGEYTQKTPMYWRSFPSLSACLADHLARMRSDRYRGAHAIATGAVALDLSTVKSFGLALYGGGYFTADPVKWAEDVFKNATEAEKQL